MSDTHDLVVAMPTEPAEAVRYDAITESGALAPALRCRWRTAMVVTLTIGAALAAAVWTFVRPMYKVSATAHVAPVVRPILFKDADTDITRRYHEYMATEATVIASPAVILATLATPEVRSLRFVTTTPAPERAITSRLEVEQISGTQLLEICMVGDSAEDMAVIVNSLLETYLRKSGEKKQEWDEKILHSLRAEQAELQARINVKNIELRQLATENGLATPEDPGAAGTTWVAELRRLLTEARKDRALAQAKLEALDASKGADEFVGATSEGYRDYRRADPEWQDTHGRLTMLETAVLDDDRLGRGAQHPDVKDRAGRLESLRAALSLRESELREQWLGSVRQQLLAQRMDAEVTTTVLEAAIDDLKLQQSEVARQTFLLDDIRHERERLEHALAQVRQKVWNVEVEQNRMARVTIDSRAVAPGKPNVDKRPKYTAAACLLSLCLGAGAALLRHRLDKSVRDPAEVTGVLGMTLLGSIQRVPGTNGAILAYDERVADPLRGISAALLAASKASKTHGRLITSPTAQSGKSSLAVNLACSLASTGRSVLLVDGDNSGQGVTRAFEKVKALGLNEFLHGTCGAEAVVHETHVENLRVMPAGSRDVRFGEVLASRHVQGRLRAVFEPYDEVIVDSPPVLASSVAVVLATLVDEVVMVLRAGRSTQQEAQTARRLMETVGGKLSGVILNAVDPKTAPYSYYGYAPIESDASMETKD